MGCPGVHAQVTLQNGYTISTISSGRVYASILHVIIIVSLKCTAHMASFQHASVLPSEMMITSIIGVHVDIL
jgi:hypothetical protein